VMLSEETTLGTNSVAAVSVMTRIAQEIEKDYPERAIVRVGQKGDTGISDSVTSSVVKTAHDVGAKAIIALTNSGYTARMISRHKPHSTIVAMSQNIRTIQKLALVFGCRAIQVPYYNTMGDVFKIVREYCIKEKLAKKGDKVVIVAGYPFIKKSLSTNMLLVETL
jgi:pyruvate kinase